MMRFGIRVIGLVSTVILARLLVPEDFGLVALATVLAAGLAVFSEFSFDVALIQNQNAQRIDYDTAWTLSIIRNGLIAALLVALADPAAAFFGDSRLEEILYWLALGTFIEGFQNIGIVDFRKNLVFSKDFAFMTSAKLVSFSVTIVLAFFWRDYWALIAGILAGNCARVVLSFILHDFRPVLALKAWRPILSFSKWLLMNNILSFAYNRG
ncbi:MAG: oligosaccharide flippase family protein, partial [Alphaproteobacteria bacterium]